VTLLEAILPLARQVLEELERTPRPSTKVDPGNWVRAPDDSFRLQLRVEDSGRDAQMTGAIFIAIGSPQGPKAIDALLHEPRLQSRLGKLVGPANLFQMLCAPAYVLQGVLRRVATSPLVDLTEKASAAIEAEIAFRTTESAPVLYLAPLSGVDLEAGPVSVGSGMTIERMTDAEISVCIQNGFLGHSPFMSAGIFHVRDYCAIRITSVQPVIIHEGSAASPTPNPHKDVDEEARAEIQNVLLALRLLKRGDVSVAGVLVSCPPIVDGWAFHPGQVLEHRDRQVLTAGDAAELASLVELARNTRRDRSLAVAARRFGFALERHRPEDRLLDLAIAGEALFLQNTQTESAHKFAERGALLVETAPAARRALFEFLKRIYGVRSKLAHGNEVSTAAYRDRRGVQTTPEAFTREFEDVIRAALRAALEAKAGGRWPPDWEAWLFGVDADATAGVLEPDAD